MSEALDEKQIIDIAMAEWERLQAAATVDDVISARMLEEFIGKTFTRIEKVHVYRNDRIAEDHGDELRFFLPNGDYFRMCHYQDCCEAVWLDDICGDLDHLIGKPIIWAEEVTSNSKDPPKDQTCADESHTWTFYKLRTSAGDVTLRWYGSSNGYYSESVDISIVSAKAA